MTDESTKQPTVEGNRTIFDPGPEMAEILESLAETGGVRGISDPVLWQKETRKDRKLPNRDG